jgi:hypothetical protein
MNTKIIKLPDVQEIGEVLKYPAKIIKPLALLVALLLLWILIPEFIDKADETTQIIVSNILPLILISLITFMIVSALCWWLLHRYWMALGLPNFKLMVSQFKTLSTWQQLNFYWFSFALLLLAALGCLSSIC